MAETAPKPLPPDQPTVIARSLCLGSLILRGVLERLIQSPDDPTNLAAHKELTARLSRWLNEQDFTANFTLDELNGLSQPPGAWDAARLSGQFHRTESLGVLFWALSIHHEMPTYDMPFEPPNLEGLLGWPDDAVANPVDAKLGKFPHIAPNWFKQVAQLRPAPIIAAHRGAAECWQWRAHVAALQRTNVPPPEGQNYEMLIAIAAEEAFEAAAIPRPIERDFPLFQKPFSQLTEDEATQAAAIAASRRIALDWLCGYATEWDNVSVANW